MKNFAGKPDKIFRHLFYLTPLVLLFCGCHREQVQVYQVNDQEQQTQQAIATATNSAEASLPPGHPDVSGDTSMQSMPGGIVASDTSAAPLTWMTPAGWSQVPPSEMRVASFKVAGANGKQADVSIVPLAGMGGGDFANVNRWRGQVGLPDAADDVLQNASANVEAGGQPAQLYDLAGNSSGGGAERIIGVIQHRDGTSWFFKMTGDADLVEQQKPVFVDFLKTLSFGSQAAPAQLPPGHPDINSMSAPASAGPVPHAGPPNWQVPAGWQEVDGGSFLVAKFMISGDGGATAAVNVSSSAGDGGGLGANVNRWRGQIGLRPISEVLTVAFDVSGGSAQLVDLSGTNAETSQPADIVGVMVMQPDRTWFYKLMGDPKLVAAQKDAFTTFVKGVQY